MRIRRHKAFPAWVFGIGCLAFLLAAFWLSRTNDARVDERFDNATATAVAAIDNQTRLQLTLLRGTAGLFEASESVSVDEFEAYVNGLDLETNYPGVLGIGFAVIGDQREDLETLADAVDPARTVAQEAWPNGDRSQYSTILFIEPRNERNIEAIGFDMMSEENRRTAMLRAARTGQATASGRVQLVQEIDPEKQPGFLVYMPIYRDGESQQNAEAYGWAYSPLRAYDLFGTVFEAGENTNVSISIYDGEPTAENLLFRSAERTTNLDLRSIRTLEVGGRTWTVEVVALPGFAVGLNSAQPWIIGLAGIFLSFLLALLAGRQAREAERVESQVKMRTAELRATNTRLRAEVSAREKAESTVRQMQRIESVGQLTGGIAHDFNNMLAIVIGNLDMAKRKIDDPKKLDRLIEQARIGADRAADLTQRLLAFSRQQPLSPKQVDVNDLISHMGDLLERTIGVNIDVRTELSNDAWPILADRSQLENAVLNLAINARDAMSEGDTLTIYTSNEMHTPQDAPDGTIPNSHVCITVSDTGSGMPEDVLEKALDPFFTTKDVGKGTGLGLSQVFGFVRQSGGDLIIESTEGEGTQVRIFLPRFNGATDAATEAENTMGIDEEIRGGVAQEVVLVVDDEEQVRTMTVEVLRELGYSVVHAVGGLEALDKLRVNPGIRLVLTDIVMPEMNGHQLAEHALSAVPDLKFVFVSGYDAADDNSKVAEQHDIELLQKPFTQESLAKIIRKTLDESSGSGPGQVDWPSPPQAPPKKLRHKRG